MFEWRTAPFPLRYEFKDGVAVRVPLNPEDLNLKPNPAYYAPGLIEPLQLHPDCFIPFLKTMKDQPQYYAAKDDEEIFTFGPHPTPEDALDAVLREMKLEQLSTCHASDGPDPESLPDIETGLILKVGILTTHVPSVNVEALLEELNTQAGAECGEVADYFLAHVSKESKRELEEAMNMVLAGWLHKYGMTPTFGAMSDVRRYIRVKKVEPYPRGWMVLTGEPGTGTGRG